MALDKNAELLGKVPIFAGLEPEQLSVIVTKGKKTFFEAGALIIASGESGQTAYLILSGDAVTRPPQGSELAPEKLGPGTLIGETAVLTETVHSLDVVAQERMRTLALWRDDLFEAMEADPSIAYSLAEKIRERLMFLARDMREVDARFALLEASIDDVIASVG
jgi:CRP-like cAMP-binding protein